jgi:hypothetical protein
MTHPPRGFLLIFCALIAACLASRDCAAVNIRVDYSQDGSGFFTPVPSNNPLTPAQVQARAAVNAAAAFYSGILEDSLAPVVVPPRYFGSFNGTADFFLEFANPNEPQNLSSYVQLASYTIAQDEYVLFVGGAGFSGTQIASAGLGGINAQWSLVAADVPVAQGIFDDFQTSVNTRGQSSGFAHWGGTMSFDDDGSTNWNLNLAQGPSSGQSDLYSVALHEIGHMLGFGSTTLKDSNLVNASNRFIGAAAVAEHGGPVPMQSGGGHWAEGTMSTVYNGSASQEALFDPSFNGSVRKKLTLLDAAGLTDLGWSVAAPTAMPGDFNGDHAVDAADYATWRDGIGSLYTMADYNTWRQNYGATLPASGVAIAAQSAQAAAEPGSMALLLAPLLLAAWRRR